MKQPPDPVDEAIVENSNLLQNSRRTKLSAAETAAEVHRKVLFCLRNCVGVM